MTIQVGQLIPIIGTEGQRPEHLPSIDEDVFLLRGTKADVIYCDTGNGDYAVLHVDPKSEPLETILKAILTEAV
jgi:hypothetical protein